MAYPNIARGLRAYKRSLVRESIHPRRYASHVASVSSICEPSSCSLEESCDTLMEDDAKIACRFATDGSIVEYKDRVDGFYRQREFPIYSLR